MKTWMEFARMSPQQRARADVAEMNLACAVGLPGIEKFDGDTCLRRIEEDTAFVRWFTEDNWDRYHAKPGHFRHGEIGYRLWCLVRGPQMHKGIRYNPDKADPEVPFEPEDSFLYPLLQGNGGTCASLPVYFTAVGRRLGYPLKLAHTRGHLFFRWHVGGEYINVEATGQQIGHPPDEHYRTEKFELTPEENASDYYLNSFTPEEELSGFLCTRGSYYFKQGDLGEATRALAWGFALEPRHEMREHDAYHAFRRWREKIKGEVPPLFPLIHCRWANPRVFPATFPMKLERDICCMSVAQGLLDDPEAEREWWGPLRRGEKVKRRPTEVTAYVRPDGTAALDYQYIYSDSGYLDRSSRYDMYDIPTSWYREPMDEDLDRGWDLMR